MLLDQYKNHIYFSIRERVKGGKSQSVREADTSRNASPLKDKIIKSKQENSMLGTYYTVIYLCI